MIDTPPSKPRRSTIGVALLVLLAALAPLVVILTPRSSEADSRTTLIHRGVDGQPRIGLVGDSSLSGVRWYGTYGDLFQLNFVFDAESCRRTSLPSCRGREGYAPENGLQTVRRLNGEWGSVLVMVTGYNDPGYQFDNAVDDIVREARSQGIDHVMWLTMRTADVSYVSPDYRSDSYTFRDNNRILLQKAVQYRGYLQVADWATYSARRSDWVAADGVHMTVAGGYAITSFVVQQARQVIRGRTVTPPPNPGVRGWAPISRGAYGSRVLRLQHALINRGVAVVGGADGVFGTYTERAVMTFQRREGLPASGVVDARTAARLGLYNPPPSVGSLACRMSVPVRRGDKLDQVSCLERHLVARGFKLPRIDRYFRSGTADAIDYFDAVSGIRRDGQATRATYRALGIYRAPPRRPDCTLSRFLQPGDRLPDVTCLKAHLRGLGYNASRDALFGDSLGQAVRHFRRRLGMKMSVVANVRTLRRLGVYAPPPPTPICKVSHAMFKGDRSLEVRCLRRHLRARGFSLSSGKLYSSNVAMVVRHVKPKYGLSANGVASVRLLRRMHIYQPPVRRTATRVETPGTIVPPSEPPSDTTLVPPTTAPPSTPPSTTVPSTTPPATTVPATTPPPATTVPATSVPGTVPTSTVPASSPSSVPGTSAEPAPPITAP